MLKYSKRTTELHKKENSLEYVAIRSIQEIVKDHCKKRGKRPYTKMLWDPQENPNVGWIIVLEDVVEIAPEMSAH